MLTVPLSLESEEYHLSNESKDEVNESSQPQLNSTVNSVGKMHHFQRLLYFGNHPIYRKLSRFSQFIFQGNSLQMYVTATILVPELDKVHP